MLCSVVRCYQEFVEFCAAVLNVVICPCMLCNVTKSYYMMCSVVRCYRELLHAVQCVTCYIVLLNFVQHC